MAEPRPDLAPVDLPTFARDDLPVSRGAWAHIARLFCALAPEVEVPKTQYEASRLIIRLRDELEQQAGNDETPPDGGERAW